MFDYVAIDVAGRRVKGSLAARDDGLAFEQLKRQGFAPLTIRAARGGGSVRGVTAKGLSDREAAEFLSDLAALLRAGSSLRAALGVVSAKADRPVVRTACRDLLADVSGGAALEQAFARALGRRQAFVPALVAAGEASGDLAGGFERAADMLGSQVRLRDQLVSTLSYPAFVLVTSLIAMAVILLFVIPSLAPLVEQPGATPPMAMRVLIGASDFMRGSGPALSVLAAAGALGLALSVRTGALGRALDRVALDGPFRRITGALVFGGFALSLGAMLSAGAPMADALRLATRSIRSPAARKRVEPVVQGVRQGARLSDLLARIQGVPPSIVRLAAIGEASGGLGPMLARAGKLEEAGALRRIEAVGRLVGPTLIILLGGLIGLLMGALLSGVTQIGDSALG
jgi:type II secretory pathway component PulF